MKTVYFISGLGADKRAFQYLDLSFCNPVFLPWISSIKNESLQEYAARFAHQIKEEEPVIVGLSFGGIVAVEIARQVPVKKLILLSSAKTVREIPFYYKLLRYLPLHNILPVSFIKSANHFAYRLMGIAKRDDKIIFTNMLNSTDNHLIKWSIHQIAHWRNRQFPAHTYHIHGTGDMMLPHMFIRPDVTIPGGRHLMLMTKPETISTLLKKAIEAVNISGAGAD